MKMCSNSLPFGDHDPSNDTQLNVKSGNSNDTGTAFSTLLPITYLPDCSFRICSTSIISVNNQAPEDQDTRCTPAKMPQVSPDLPIDSATVASQSSKVSSQTEDRKLNSPNLLDKSSFGSDPESDSVECEESISSSTGHVSFKCPLCSLTAISKIEFSQHLMSHTLFSYRCLRCEYDGKSSESLKAHMRQEHSVITEQEEEEDMRLPKINAQGKAKLFRCKQCCFNAITKLDFWEHSRVHIRAEKLLTCSKCPFVTEYKHHLEYHLRNHFGSKPFRCSICSYSCVNKSMLNSHMKSHSTIYQYRCDDCSYVSKYCHSLKLHLRKYNHRPGAVLNADGIPCQFPLIDVYGTRRGPKLKSIDAECVRLTNAERATFSVKENCEMQDFKDKRDAKKESKTFGPSPLPKGQLKCSMCNFSTRSREHFSKHMLIHAAADHKDLAVLFGIPSEAPNNHPNIKAAQDEYNQLMYSLNHHSYLIPKSFHECFANGASSSLVYQSFPRHQADNNAWERSVSDFASFVKHVGLKNECDQDENLFPLDLSNEVRENKPPKSFQLHPFKKNVEKSRRRKGVAIKLERHRSDEESLSSHEDEMRDEEILGKPRSNLKIKNRSDQESHTCIYCDMTFGDVVMYTMHMGYHGYQHPFTCNMCGQQTQDKVSFFLHIARASHS